MWVFTQHGFYSVVAAKPSKDRSGELKRLGVESDDTHVLVRARIEEDLQDLKEHYLPDLVIFSDRGADYPFRCYMTRQEWKGILAVSVDELDYSGHFKEAARDGSKGASGRYSAYMSVWSTLNSMAKVKAYSGSTWSGGSSSTSYSPTGYKGSYPKVGEDDGKPLGTESPTYKYGYEWDSDKHLYVKTKESKPAEVDRSNGKIGVSEVTALLISKATEDFTTSQVTAMDDDAYELYKRADELPPSKQPVSRSWIDDQLAQMTEEAADLAALAALDDAGELDLVELTKDVSPQPMSLAAMDEAVESATSQATES